MNVLVLNCGSSSLKFRLVEADTRAGQIDQRRLASGSVNGIGARAALDFSAESGAHLEQHSNIRSQGDAARAVLDWLSSIEAAQTSQVDATGHRIVHGGARFLAPTRIDASMMQEFASLQELAPLHNGPALDALRAVMEAFGAQVPAVATFDTAFHQSMPQRASLYALPLDLMERHGIRRYGFHGLAHRWMVERFGAISGRTVERSRLITLQLGSGCSIAAIDAGRSIDTSMGFTPLEGLMMGTRSGDIDPSLPSYLAAHERIDAAAVEQILNTRSGLLGVSGRSADIRELLTAESQGDERAALAIEMFCYRVRKAIGAYLAALGGADAIVFGGGIGEHATAVRERICSGMDWCGLRLDAERNAAAVGSEMLISAEGTTPQIYVVPLDEEALIVRDTVQCLQG
jgi:acetate kinase